MDKNLSGFCEDVVQYLMLYLLVYGPGYCIELSFLRFIIMKFLTFPIFTALRLKKARYFATTFVSFHALFQFTTFERSMVIEAWTWSKSLIQYCCSLQPGSHVFSDCEIVQNFETVAHYNISRRCLSPGEKKSKEFAKHLSCTKVQWLLSSYCGNMCLKFNNLQSKLIPYHQYCNTTFLFWWFSSSGRHKMILWASMNKKYATA